MFDFLKLKNEILGVDLSDTFLKLVKLKKKSKGFVLASLNKIEIPKGTIEGGVIKDEESLVKIIKSAIKSAKGARIKTKYVAVSLPEEKSFLQIIQMPKMDEKDLELAVSLEAENYIPLPIGEVYLDFNAIPPVRNYFDNLEILMVAMPKKIVDSYISCFKKAGLTPIIFETESESIARALIKKEKNSSPVVLVNVGKDSVNFIIFSGNFVRFTCSIPISLNEKTKTELTKQIDKYINFYCDHSSYEYLLPSAKISKILLCGRGSELKGLPEFLFKKLKIPTELADPLTNFASKKSKLLKDKNILSFATAIGLAMREDDI
jgi:type IV pilus assembly protein PilM